MIPSPKLINIIISEKELNQLAYSLYFSIKPYIDKNTQEQIETEISNKYEIDLITFQQKCQKGENDTYICQLIQKDEIDEFITHVNMNNYYLESKIKDSFFETNDFLIKSNPTLIEYAAFCGSICIFRYLWQNEVKVEPSIWKYAIHSGNPDLIHLLEEINVQMYLHDILNECIKCHHNSIADYIINNYMDNNYEDKNYICLKYYNFEYISTDYESVLSSLDIDNPIFGSFISLTEITIPDSPWLNSNLIKLKKLCHIKISSSIKSIWSYAFYGYSSLKQITIPSSVKEIGPKAFSDCSSLIHLTIPPYVVSIGDYAFYRCSSLTQMTIPSSVKLISNNAFAECLS